LIFCEKMPLEFRIFCLFVVLPVLLPAQQNHPQDYFGPPVEFNKSISGTFGELRPGHFHAGIDIRTHGVEGKPLLAIADGYVSRVAIGPGGYGKAIYITHNNGYTSVYAHCLRFYDTLDKWVKTEQYRLKSFPVNLFPEPHKFNVTKGQVIALSGNTGSSQGPHLHFEIRKTDGQIPVNPMHFGFRIKDFIRPVINKFKIYPFDKFSLINGKNEPLEPELAGWGPYYRLAAGDTIALSGLFYFGINTWDKLNDSNNKNGVYSVELFVDSNLVYSHKMDNLSFAEARYINSFIDYSNYSSRGIRFQKTYIEPGNRLSVYGQVKDNGVYKFIADSLYQLRYVVRDFHQNESSLIFWVKSKTPVLKDFFTQKQVPHKNQIFGPDRSASFELQGFKLYIPKNALYDTLAFNYSTTDQTQGLFSKIHHVHHPGKAIHGNIEIILPANGLSELHEQKALIVRFDKGKMIPESGVYESGFVKTTTRNFGDYAIAVDTLPPEIAPVNIFNGKKIGNQQTLRIKIADDLSGIAKYEPSLNGEWLLMEYDPKNDVLIYFVDERVKTGENILRLQVWDERDNTSELEIRFEK
jgi:hypothetical protein